MNEKIVKLCRNLAAVAMVMGALGNLISGFKYDSIGFGSLGSFSSLVFVISMALMAGALFASNMTILAAGCGLRALYLLLCVIDYIDWGAPTCYILATLIQTIGLVLLAVALLQKKDCVQFIAISVALGVFGVCVHYLFDEGIEFGVKLSNCAFGINSTILGVYLPVLMGILAPKSNAPLAITNSVAVSPVAQSANVDSFEKINKLKELLDMGAISQEEFDAKKKEILNL